MFGDPVDADRAVESADPVQDFADDELSRSHLWLARAFLADWLSMRILTLSSGWSADSSIANSRVSMMP